MPIELRKEMLAQREVVIRTGCEAFTDIDIIVPDTKPDVLRILQIDANPVIMDKTLFEGKLLFDCRLDVCILYAADGGGVKNIRTQQSFTHQVNSKDITKGLSVEACCSMERLDCRIINSRKLSISTTVAIDYCLMRERELPIIVGIESNDCQVMSSPIKAFVSSPQAVTEIVVKETFDIPQGKSDADEILRANVRLCNKEVRYAGTKAVVKGELLCSVLYLCDIEPTSLQTMEYALPFTEVVDLPDIFEGEDCSVDFIYKNTNCSAKQDNDGDNRIIFVEVQMDAVVSAGKEVTLNAITDAYSPSCDMEINSQPIMLEELVAKRCNRECVKAVAAIPTGQPDAMGVLHVSASPGTVTASPDGRNVIVEGNIVGEILYRTVDPDMPVSSYKYTMPFTSSFEMEGVDERCLFDVNVDVDNISYNINLPDEIELRCNICISVGAMRTMQINCITDVEEKPLEQVQSCSAYCVKIYFVRKGDTLWNIAKRYRVSLDRLMGINGLDQQSVLMPGQQLMIP
ncbi:MAG: DUF3794 domain-containing protein [Eubacteriales bacterium]|nr:DUF3794 domain-containing protein [Eubacteriales bacterium]